VTSAITPALVSKEARALALPWLACAAIVIAPALVIAPWFFGTIPALVYFLGASALGALSIGHEYTNGTIGLLLSMPARREQVLAVKLGVLAAMLLALWGAAETWLFPGTATALTLLPVLYGVLVAPWLTMACRSAVAGTVFTIVIPAALYVAGDSLGESLYGRGPELNAFRTMFLWRGTLIASAIGAVASWRTFMRLEAIEGAGPAVSLPSWLQWPTASTTTRTTSPAPAPPIWMLIRKEVRLHDMSMVVAGLYLLGCVIVTVATPLAPQLDDWFTAVTLLYQALVALLIGSFASAGERQLGTLQWQLLMPIAASKQWMVKAGVAVTLSLLLAVGLPAAYAAVTSVLDPSLFLRPWPPLLIVLLTAGSMYVSSVSTSGLLALLMSLATAMVGVTLFALAAIKSPPQFASNSSIVLQMLVVGFVALLLRLAFGNHRTADRPVTRLLAQGLVIAALIGAGAVARVALR
jgi:hypothetical protein